MESIITYKARLQIPYRVCDKVSIDGNFTQMLVPTLCVGMQHGRFESCSMRYSDAKRPEDVPTQSVGTRSLTIFSIY
ncbi:hypothetical protein QUF90_23240 [Desulfococcaceae bacterium HSG9]|nr:hypothetical protein [Desulfococcaceae bacterium HSG9]